MRIYQLSNFGIMGEEKVAYTGANAKMNEFEAAMGLCNLNHFEDNVIKRGAVYKLYEELFSKLDGIRMLKHYREDVIRNYSYCPVFFDKGILGRSRDEVYIFLASKQVYARKYFYPLTSKFECYKNAGFRGETPIAEKMASQVLTLPMYADIDLEDVVSICDLIESLLLV